MGNSTLGANPCRLKIAHSVRCQLRGRVASEPLESKSLAPAAEVAASSCLRRAAALAGLGLELWG